MYQKKMLYNERGANFIIGKEEKQTDKYIIKIIIHALHARDICM
jgi:hypothetical protein